MDITRKTIISNGYNIPCVEIEHPESKGIIIFIHGYGGNKEELIGPGWRISEFGFKSCIIDLPGHGESNGIFDNKTDKYVETVIDYYGKHTKKLAVIGHSIGGRLALVSKAKMVIGISPTIIKEFSNETKAMITDLRSYRVTESNADTLWELHSKLPDYDFTKKEKSLILYGTRDVQEIINACKKTKENFTEVFEIEKATHGDILVNEKVISIISEHLIKWM